MALWLPSCNGLASIQQREAFIFLQLLFRHIQYVSAFIMRAFSFFALCKEKSRVSDIKSSTT